jgi:hypothetical protein
MSSARQIAANRRNAQRSSGPRTAAGKKKVGDNALRHGLAAAASRDPNIDTQINRLAKAIAKEARDATQREQASVIAESEIMLLRVRAARINIFEQVLSGMGAEGVIGRSQLKQMNRLERYERRALSRRQRAIGTYKV